MRTTLALTTYQRPDALAAVLASLAAQSVAPDEVMIADDGSGEDTRAVIERFVAQAPYPVHHIRQEHQGFRAARVRNLAIARATGEYIVLIDGDMLLHREFIADHRHFARRGAFTQGVRIPLDAQATAEMLRGVLAPGARFAINVPDQSRPSEDAATRSASITADAPARAPSLHGAYTRGDHIPVDPTNKSVPRTEPRAPTPVLRTPQPHGRRRLYAFHSLQFAELTRHFANAFVAIKSCNQGFWRDDLIAVNGFDEDFVGWGAEDKELAARIRHHGVARQTLLFGAIAFHLHHPPVSRDRHAANERRLALTLSERRTRCERGLDAHLGPML